MANKEIKIKQVISDHHMLLPATGAYGGLSPDGSYVICSFFVERPTVGSEVKLVISDIGAPIAQHEEKDTDFTREMVSTLTFSRATAKSIGEWLIKLADTGNPNG